MSLSPKDALLGMLALQNGFVSQQQLLAAIDESGDSTSGNFAEILCRQQALSEQDRKLLTDLMMRHLKQHMGSVAASMQSMQSTASAMGDVQQLLCSKSADVSGTVTYVPKADPGDVNFAPTRIDDQLLAASSHAINKSRTERYEILGLHAEGGLGAVYRARDWELDRIVALKEVRSQHVHDEASRARFVLEGEITGKLEHPGIVPVYGSGAYADGRPFYAMRFVQGQTLHHAIRAFHKQRKSNGTSMIHDVAFRKLLGRFVDICQAVGFAHSRGVLHRDLKPGNVMLGQHGETLVVDWGLAKLFHEKQGSQSQSAPLQIAMTQLDDHTLPGSAVGTPGFMSPEQATGQVDHLGPATDIYSLGCILYMILTGDVPLRERNLAELVKRLAAGNIEEPRRKNPEIPRPLAAICQRALATRVEDRHLSAESLADEIEQFLAGEAVSSYPENWLEKSTRWTRNHRTLVTTTTVAMLICVLALVVGLASVSTLNRKLAKTNSDLTLSNQQLDQSNQELTAANYREQRLREAAELSAEKERAAAIVSLIDSEIASQAAEEAVQQSELARQRLKQANTVASEIVFTIDRQLRPIAGTEQVRNDLLQRASKLLEWLLVDATDDLSTLRLRGAQLEARAIVAERYEDLDAAADLWKQSLDLRHKLRRLDSTSPVFLADLSVSYLALGKIAAMRADVTQAKDYYLKSLDLRRQVVAREESSESRQHLGECYSILGSLHLDLREIPSAENYFEKSTKIFQTILNTEPQRIETLNSLTVVYQSQGTLQRVLGDSKSSRSHFMKSLELVKTLLSLEPDNIDSQLLLARTYQELATNARFANDFASARTHLRDAATIQEKLLTVAPQDRKIKRSLLMTYRELGSICSAQMSYPEAQKAYERALSLAEDLIISDAGNQAVRNDLQILYTGLGLLNQRQGHLKNALHYFQEASRIVKEVLATAPDHIGLQRELANCSNRLALVCSQLGDWNRARASYLQSYRVYQSWLAREAENRSFQSLVATAAANLSDVCRSQGDYRNARIYIEECVRIRERQYKTVSDEMSIQKSLAASLIKLGFLKRKAGEFHVARTCFERSLQLRSEILAQAPSLATRNDLAMCHSNLGDLFRDTGQLSQAIEAYQKCIAIRKDLRKAEPENVILIESLALNYDRLCKAYRFSNKLDLAEKSLQASRDLHRKWIQLRPNSLAAHRGLSANQIHLGQLLVGQMQRAQDRERAQQTLRTAIRLAEQLAARAPNDAILQQNLMAAHYYMALAQSDPRLAIEHFQTALAVLDQMIERGQQVQASRRTRTIILQHLQTRPAVAE